MAVFAGLDFETYGSRSLPDVGLDNYLSDPNFMPLLASVAFLDRGQLITQTFDFVTRGKEDEFQKFQIFRNDNRRVLFAAHNAGFERGVLKRSFNDTTLRIINTAVISRCLGAGSRLEDAAPQLLSSDKMPDGKRLIQKFSVGEPPTEDVADDPDWSLFIEYCELDAHLSFLLALNYKGSIPRNEFLYENITYRMNQRGWKVDMKAVEAMQARYQKNLETLMLDFQTEYDPDGKLNLNSLPQLKQWCKERGVTATSFDKLHVEKMLRLLEKKLKGPLQADKVINYTEVKKMLELKQALGGSSLAKLPVIQRLTGEDGYLRNQYIHCGAGRTYRTTGVGAQMQNLHRLSNPREIEDLYDPNAVWTNEDMADNLRQVFTSSHPKGQLLVGDFSAVESRGLAFLAGETWKLDAYRSGKDVYKVLAAEWKHIAYEDVIPEQRKGGKLGELSCGYGAGPGAVCSFAEGMGMQTTMNEATIMVNNWRSSNPNTKAFWNLLDQMIHEVVATSTAIYRYLTEGIKLYMSPAHTPESLIAVHPGAQTIDISLWDKHENLIMTRRFQGCYERGRNICYYAPTHTNGKLWSPFYMDPKTKRNKFYDVYGGKLAGIITQSFCRELFFESMAEVEKALGAFNVPIIGQFHDEIVLDYNPDEATISMRSALELFKASMEGSERFPTFPLTAEIKHDYRYIK